MIVLLDTDVLIDCLRGTIPARQWLEASADQPLTVPGIVAMEIVSGCRNRDDLGRCKRFLDNFQFAWPDASEFERAYDLLLTFYLSGNLSIPDAIVAAMALGRSACLLTFNLKHFKIVPGLDVKVPYSREEPKT